MTQVFRLRRNHRIKSFHDLSEGACRGDIQPCQTVTIANPGE